MQIEIRISKYLRDYLKYVYDYDGHYPSNTISIGSNSKIATYIIPYLKIPPISKDPQKCNFIIILNWNLKFFNEHKNYLSIYDQRRFQYSVNYMFMHEFTNFVYKRKVKNFIHQTPELQKDIILAFCEEYRISFDWDADVYDTMKKRLYRYLKLKK